MFELDLKSMLFGDDLHLFLEIVVRTAIMFLMILLVLRVSGKRGVRQLTLFEVAIILGLGSAAGDPMFQEDLPIFHAFLVFAVVMAVYKTLTWLATKSTAVHRILEGHEMTIVIDGVFNLKNQKSDEFSTMEFFAELRNQSVEHLGQVRRAVLEVDGSLSILFYADKEVKFGLPLFPDAYKEVDPAKHHGLLACMYCGSTAWSERIVKDSTCSHCKHDKWTVAYNRPRVG